MNSNLQNYLNEKAPVFDWNLLLNMIDEEPDPEHQANPTLFEWLKLSKTKRLQSFDWNFLLNMIDEEPDPGTSGEPHLFESFKLF